jgi:hypothetical protein
MTRLQQVQHAIQNGQSRVCGPGLPTLARSSFAGIDCAYEFQCCLPQWRTEEILRAHLERLGVRGISLRLRAV